MTEFKIPRPMDKAAEIGNWIRLLLLICAIAVMWGGLRQQFIDLQSSMNQVRGHIAHIDAYLEKASKGGYTTPDPLTPNRN